MNSITVVCPLVFFLLAIMLSVPLRLPLCYLQTVRRQNRRGQSKMDHHPETREISVTRHGTKTNIQKKQEQQRIY
jgi:hypothetical protein